MPKDIPTIDDDTPGHLTVYIQNPADGSVGTATVNQYRDLYRDRGWTISTPDAHAEHMRALADETTTTRRTRPDLLYPPEGRTAAQRATSRSSSSTSSSKEG